MDDLTKTIIERRDLAHLALFLWAKGAEFSREARKGRETRATLLSEFEYRLADLRLSLAARRFSLALDDMVRKYRPDQPRAPKGTPEGGRWVEDWAFTQQPKISPQRVRVAQFGGQGAIDLLDHEGLNGAHTIAEHVAKTDAYLLARVGGGSLNIGLKFYIDTGPARFLRSRRPIGL